MVTSAHNTLGVLALSPTVRLCHLDTACLLFASSLAALLLPQPALATEPGETAPRSTKSPLSLYASVALGVSNVGPTARGVLTVAPGPWFIAGTAGASDELALFGPAPSQNQQDAGLIGGLHLRGNFYVVALGAGLGYVHSVKRGRYQGTADGVSATHEVYEKLDNSTLGVPLLAQATLYWGPVGVGAMVFANANTTLPSIGFAGTLSLGSF